ncbi:MAG TPA: hypothetical protein VN130_10890 [Xanthobacteraceae bacterium]|nr:hypothetical protein [Xanthobacteraceae bacterium]
MPANGIVPGKDSCENDRDNTHRRERRLRFQHNGNSTEMKMMTDPQGGAWIPLGGQLKDMWEKPFQG